MMREVLKEIIHQKLAEQNQKDFYGQFCHENTCSKTGRCEKNLDFDTEFFYLDNVKKLVFSEYDSPPSCDWFTIFNNRFDLLEGKAKKQKDKGKIKKLEGSIKILEEIFFDLLEGKAKKQKDKDKRKKLEGSIKILEEIFPELLTLQEKRYVKVVTGTFKKVVDTIAHLRKVEDIQNKKLVIGNKWHFKCYKRKCSDIPKFYQATQTNAK